MRIRTIKPEFWANPELSALSEFTRLLALGLLNYADDEGYFWADPAMIRGSLFPFESSSVRIQGALTELSNAHYVVLYNGKNGRVYGQVKTFQKHQKINRPTPSKLKDCIDFTEGSLSQQGTLTLGTGNREQGTSLFDGPATAKPSRQVKTLLTEKPRNELFDALAEATGFNPREINGAGGMIGKALADIRKATPGVTVLDIRQRASRYRTRNPTWTLTPTALANHWASLGHAGAADGSARLGQNVEI